jgi:hypothetical protein
VAAEGAPALEIGMCFDAEEYGYFSVAVFVVEL